MVVNSVNHRKMGKRFGFPAMCRMSFVKCSNRKGARQHLGQMSREEVPFAAGACTSTQLTHDTD